jgi:hypothetical protein
MVFNFAVHEIVVVVVVVVVDVDAKHSTTDASAGATDRVSAQRDEACE